LCRITENIQVGYTKTGIYSNHWLVGNLKCQTFSGLKVVVIMLLCTPSLVCTVCENYFHCQISLLVSFVLFGYIMKYL